MRSAAGRALDALTLLVVFATLGAAQDTAVVVRHVLPVDTSRVRDYRRAFDIVVNGKDSSVVIGQREVSLSRSEYAGSPSWLLVETRSGLVPAVESLYLAPDTRPLHWSSSLGAARLALEFVGDSILGATSAPSGRRSVVAAGRSDLLVSTAMIEALLPLLPLGADWADSVGVLSVDLASSVVLPAELAVLGEEQISTDSVTARPAWVVALRADTRNVLFWVDKENGAVVRIQQPLPAHVGALLEYRRRPEPANSPPASLPP